MPWPKGVKRSEETREKMRVAHTGLILRTPEDRFWKKVDKVASRYGCWLWTGAMAKDPKNNYGHFYYLGRIQRAHRVAYQLLVGVIPPGLCVLHNCPGGDNPRCVNPAHLFLGTLGDNVQDAWRKGTFKGSTGHVHTPKVRELIAAWHRGVAKSEAHRQKIREVKRAQSPLDDSKVREIRQLRFKGWTYRAIGTHIGVSVTTAFNVCKERTWK